MVSTYVVTSTRAQAQAPMHGHVDKSRSGVCSTLRTRIICLKLGIWKWPHKGKLALERERSSTICSALKECTTLPPPSSTQPSPQMEHIREKERYKQLEMGKTCSGKPMQPERTYAKQAGQAPTMVPLAPASTQGYASGGLAVILGPWTAGPVRNSPACPHRQAHQMTRHHQHPTHTHQTLPQSPNPTY